MSLLGKVFRLPILILVLKVSVASLWSNHQLQQKIQLDNQNLLQQVKWSVSEMDNHSESEGHFSYAQSEQSITFDEDLDHGMTPQKIPENHLVEIGSGHQN